MIDNIISKAEVLFNQKKYNQAEKLLNNALSTDPNDIYVLTLLAETNIHLENYEKADSLVDSAIGISPDSPHLFYIKARIFLQKDKYKDAEFYVKKAIELDPEDADYFALLSAIKLDEKEYSEALDISETALELDSENILALNIRSKSLLKLDRKEESFQTIEGALREDPNNAFTHANYGWSLLEKGDHTKSLEHFKESLKNDPNDEFAKSGMIESIKAKNIFYRYFLKYSFWIGNLSNQYQWYFILGIYFGSKILRGVAQNNETLRPFLIPVIVILTIFTFSSWLIEPISNLFLRFNSLGKYLLNKNERISTDLVGICLIICCSGLILYLFSNKDLYLVIAAFGFILIPILGRIFTKTKYKNAFLIYGIFMTLIGLAAIYECYKTAEIFNAFSNIFLLGFIAFQWISNFIILKE